MSGLRRTTARLVYEHHEARTRRRVERKKRLLSYLKNRVWPNLPKGASRRWTKAQEERALGYGKHSEPSGQRIHRSIAGRFSSLPNIMIVGHSDLPNASRLSVVGRGCNLIGWMDAVADCIFRADRVVPCTIGIPAW